MFHFAKRFCHQVIRIALVAPQGVSYLADCGHLTSTLANETTKEDQSGSSCGGHATTGGEVSIGALCVAFTQHFLGTTSPSIPQ